MNSKLIFSIIFLFFVSSCSLSPGMHFDSDTTWLDDRETVYIDSLDKRIIIKNISDDLEDEKDIFAYRIGIGDQIALTVWGLPDIFPLANISSDLNLRRVDANGDIFFPYVGSIRALGITQDELRESMTEALSKYFNEPQLDVTIARFNSQKVYLLGEVTTPKKINLTDIPLSLSDALGEVKGLNTNTSDGSSVYIIRQPINESPSIYKADLSSPAGFIAASNFYLNSRDIVYVNSKGTTRWNRVVSQFFPFSSFLNSVDNLTSND